MAANKYILHGGGEHAKVVLDCLQAMNAQVVRIFDPKFSDLLAGISRGGAYDSGTHRDALAIATIGENKTRKDAVSAMTHEFGKAVHPSAIISPSAKVGRGCMVMHGVIIQASSVIGEHVILNTACRIDHDCDVANYVHVAPGAVLCGRVKVGEGTLIGAGSIIIPGITIGAWSVVGAGAVVISNVPDGTIVVGNPAKPAGKNA